MMKVVICEDQATAVARTAAEIIQQVQSRSASVLGLATGHTMDAVYASLVAGHDTGQVGFSQVRSFNLDEYIGLGPDHPQSFAQYMAHAFFDRVDIPLAHKRLPNGDTRDPNSEAASYEAAIEAAGGIDLQLLGLGTNGHIGFNEPGSSARSKTRVVALTQATRTANQRDFGAAEAVPASAITMGIATILSARRIVLLALGKEKAEAVARMVDGPVSPSCPASALQTHTDITVFLDPAAACKLSPPDANIHDHSGIDG